MKTIGVSGLVKYSTDRDSHWVYVSFGDEVHNEEGDVIHDEFGVDDNSIFYYLCKEEVIDLLSAVIANQKAWDCPGGDWTIDLNELSFRTQ